MGEHSDGWSMKELLGIGELAGQRTTKIIFCSELSEGVGVGMRGIYQIPMERIEEES
jgi:hypothetical protein